MNDIDELYERVDNVINRLEVLEGDNRDTGYKEEQNMQIQVLISENSKLKDEIRKLNLESITECSNTVFWKNKAKSYE